MAKPIVAVRFEPEKIERLKKAVRAEIPKRTVSEVIRELVDDYLARRRGRNNAVA